MKNYEKSRIFHEKLVGIYENVVGCGAWWRRRRGLGSTAVALEDRAQLRELLDGLRLLVPQQLLLTS